MRTLNEAEIEDVSAGMSALEVVFAVLAWDIAVAAFAYQLGSGAAHRDR